MGGGANHLSGGAGDDRLTAIGGEDNIIDAGGGVNVMRGAAGVDIFVFDVASLAANDGLDTIRNFDPTRDKLAFIGISDSGAAGLQDDLAAISYVSGGFAVFGGNRAITFDGLAAAASYADLLDDPLSQLILADTLV